MYVKDSIILSTFAKKSVQEILQILLYVENTIVIICYDLQD